MATAAPPRTPSTHIRAIPSTLLSRTAPTIPPASQLYEPLVKAVLRHRQYKIFLHSALLSWLLVTAWRTWSGGDGDFWLLPIRPSTVAYTLATFATGALPIVILRKSHVAASPTPATSPSKSLTSAFQKQSTIHALLTYLASSLSLAALHLLITSSYDASAESHARISLFVKSRKHPYYLNGHLIYLLLSQAFIALACLVRCVLLDRFAVRWNASLTANKEKLQSFGLARAVTVTLTTLVYALLATVLYLVFFALARSIALPALYQLPFVPRLLKPFTAHFLRGQWTPLLLTRHWSLVNRAFYLAVTTIGIWEFAESAFDAVVAESISVSAHTADPGLTLVSGITSTDPYLKHFAYAELRDFASEESPAATQRRSALFGDQKYNPSMWSTLSREALLTLGRDYQLFLRRGQPAPPPAAAPAAAPKPTTPLPGHATPLLRAPVFKPAQSSPLRASLDMLSSDGPLAAAVSETAEAGASHLPELFRSVLPSTPVPVSVPVPPQASAALETAKKAEESVARVVSETRGVWRRGVGRTLVGCLPRGVVAAGERARAWWTRERVHRVAETSLPNRYVDALAAEVLCRLTCASLTEDAYGVVQRDIPKIVEALLSFLTALEDFQTELNAKYALPPPEQLQTLSTKEVAEKELLAMEAARASEVCSVVTDAIKEGIVQIVRTFGEKLSAFKFPPWVAKKLQGFVDYNQ